MLKLIFAISIALVHGSFSQWINLVNAGMVVDMFFALSGFFLVGSFQSKKYINAWHYTGKKLKRIYPYYLFAFVVLFAGSRVFNRYGPVMMITEFFTLLPEMFLLQNVGIFSGGINYPLWQLSTLFVATHILFSLLHWNEHAALNVICPVISICSFTAMANITGGTDVDPWGVMGNVVYVPLLRAMGAVSLGMFVHYPVMRILKRLEKSSLPSMPWLVSAGGVAAFGVLWLNRNSYAVMIPLFCIVICFLYRKSVFTVLFEKPVFAGLEKLSLAVYLNHSLIIYLLRRAAVFESIISSTYAEPVFLLFLLVYCFAMLWMVDTMMKLGKRFVAKMEAKYR